MLKTLTIAAIAATAALAAIPAKAQDQMAACENASSLAQQMEACTAVINDASRSQRDRGIAYLYRCQAKDIGGDAQSALPDCLEATRLNPGDSSAFNSLAIVFDNLGQYDEAVRAASQAIEVDPTYGNAYNTRSNAYCRGQQVQPSVQDRLKAMELGRLSADGMQRFLQSKGFYDGAITGEFGLASIQALTAWTEAVCP